ncbi:MAG: ABC transporter ATP-binding protein, partial [Hyphomicrobiaceae bacterium]
MRSSLEHAPNLVSLEGVEKYYGTGVNRVHALRNITLAIRAGEFAAIVGPSGSGKSTCLNIMGCLDVPDGGSCRIAGEETRALSSDARARLRRDTIGFVFQGFNLLATATAIRNVELPLVYRGMPARERRTLAQAALAAVGLADRALHRPSELSGGQQQRVAIARAIVARPRLLIADEPTGALDSVTGLSIVRLLRRLNVEQKITVLLVTHDPTVARNARRRISFMDGRLVTDEPIGP